jgi:hypothetical protein
MLEFIAVLLILFWLTGLFLRVAGGFIHLLLVVALVMIVLHFVGGR